MLLPVVHVHRPINMYSTRAAYMTGGIIGGWIRARGTTMVHLSGVRRAMEGESPQTCSPHILGLGGGNKTMSWIINSMN